ncbi:MAG: class F sortase [Anaerolineales bacterium]
MASACAPQRESTPTLPPPQVNVTHAAVIRVASTPSAPTATLPAPKSDIQQMADDLFGARQILAVQIPALNINGEVVPVGWRANYQDDLSSGAFEWDSPGGDVGWVITSALPDETGNIVLYGHNNLYSRVFENLYTAREGDAVLLQTAAGIQEYAVRYVLLLPMLGADAAQIARYAAYLQPTAGARVTLVSCYPPQSNTHRVVVIAQPTGASK